MAGGEFRFGTASIYMAREEPLRPRSTNHEAVITWPRFGWNRSHFARTSADLTVSTKGKLGLAKPCWQNRQSGILQAGGGLQPCRAQLARGRALAVSAGIL